MEELRKIVEEHTDFFQFSGEKSLELVAKAEEVLNVHLPESYKTFLLEYGLFSFGGLEYYGVLHEDFLNSSGIRDVVRFNTQLRSEFEFPNHLIAVYNEDGVQFTCLDTSNYFSDGECAIVVWDNVVKKVVDSMEIRFIDYLLDDVIETLEFQLENG